MYIIRGKINGADVYFQQSNVIGKSPCVQASGNNIHPTVIFRDKHAAENAMDNLKHGTAKCCEIVELREVPKVSKA